MTCNAPICLRHHPCSPLVFASKLMSLLRTHANVHNHVLHVVAPVVVAALAMVLCSHEVVVVEVVVLL